MRRKTTKLVKIRNKKGFPKEIQGIIKEYFANLNANTFENLEEMEKFLETYDHP
jgi:hypothetical protein